jgi:hypothetical protein
MTKTKAVMASTACGPSQRLLESRPVWQLCLLAAVVLLVWSNARWNIIHNPINLILLLSPKYVVGGALLIAAVHRWRLSPEKCAVLLLDSPLQPSISAASKRWWPIAGLAGLVGALVFLETRQPYYFSQDDNLSQFLPTMLQALRSWTAGVFPTWNPYQFLGSPTTSVGTYSLTYPPTWFSYWFATHVLGNEYAAMEVFAVLHLLAAYVVIYWAVRREGCRPSLATLAALCCVLSGYTLLVGRSWYYIIPVFVWAPLLLICFQHLRQKTVTWKWILGCGLVIGVFAHAGNVQMWAYTLLLFAFAAVVQLWTRVIPLRSVWPLLAAGLLGLAVAAPLLVPQFLATRNVYRMRMDNGVAGGLPTLFVPVTVVHTESPFVPGTFYKQYIGQLYYSGTIFCVSGVVLLVFLIFLRWQRPVVARNVWFLCALLAFLFALGNVGVVWILLSHMPGFDKFRLPFKFLELFNIFMAVAGAIVWERLLQNRRVGTRGEMAIVMVVSALLGYHCVLALPSFCSFGFEPYPSLDPGLARYLKANSNTEGVKILPLGPFRSTNADFMQSLQLQMPSLFGVFSVDGYDPLVSEEATTPRIRDRFFKSSRMNSELAAGLHEYGVGYVLTYDVFWTKWMQGAATPVYRSDHLTLWQLDPPRAMAWADGDESHSLPVTFDGAGADLDTSSLRGADWVTLNMIRRPEISARGTGRQLPVASDSWNRIRIQVPAGTVRVRVRFSPDWTLGFLGGALLLFAALLGGWIHYRIGSSRMIGTMPMAVNEIK